MKAAFITNICPHYRIQTFETLAKYHDVDYYFFSEGKEWYWQQQHGVKSGQFRYEYLPGFSIRGTQFTPSLPIKLLSNDYDVYIKCILGRFALPVTYLITRIKHKPMILWTGIWMRLQTRSHRLIFPFTRYIYHHSDAIVTYGEHVNRYLLSEGVPSERIFATTHAVDNDSYNRLVSEDEKLALLQQLDIPLGKKVILYLGRLEEVKGVSYLLDAFSSLQRDDVILVLAGEGSGRVQLQEMTHAKKIADKVRFVGYVPTNKTILYYALAWVYVLPSITVPTGKETWGLVVNEAFNQALPVIATDAVGAAAGGLVQDGVTGYVVPERRSEALANALERILNDPVLRQQMGYNAQQKIKNWDNERMVLGFRKAIDYVTKR